MPSSMVRPANVKRGEVVGPTKGRPLAIGERMKALRMVTGSYPQW